MLRLIGRLTLATLVLTAVATAYVASPFVAAWSLREAIKAKDVPTIERKVAWDSVRASLRASLAGHAQLLPEVNAAGEAIKPTMWQRVKTAFGASMLDRFIETYVTAEGLPQLYSYRKTWRETVKGEPGEPDADKPRLERFKAFIDRVEKAEFQSLTRVEVVVRDRNAADRSYLSRFELQGFEWRLTHLEVLSSAGAMGAKKLMDLARSDPME